MSEGQAPAPGRTLYSRLAGVARPMPGVLTAVFLLLVSVCALPMALFGLLLLGPALATLVSSDASLPARATSLGVVLTYLSAAIGPLVAWLLFGDRRNLWALAVGAVALAAVVLLGSAVDQAFSGFGPS